METSNDQQQPENTTDFYPVRLTGKPYHLSKEMLLQATDSILHKKRQWNFPELRFESLENGVITFRNIHPNGGEFRMTMRLEPETLWFACSCGHQAGSLCIHTFQALSRTLWYNSEDFFVDYIPGGRLETALANPDYFEIDLMHHGLRATQKDGLGTLFGISRSKQEQAFGHANSFPDNAVQPLKRDDGSMLAYIIAKPYRKDIPPFLVPCLGIPTKDGGQIRYFHRFLSGTSAADNPFLTEAQTALNGSCLEIYKLAENMGGSITAFMDNNNQQLAELFSLWQKAFSMLTEQQFIYTYRFINKRSLKGKPEKYYCNRVLPSTKKPELRFRLLDRGSLFQLTPYFFLGGEEMKEAYASALFFVQDDQHIYLLQSLRDAAIIEWMAKCGNLITVFRDHYRAFEKTVLNDIRKNYPVEIIKAPVLKMQKAKKKSMKN